jgi:hypothetical protein
MEVCDVISSPVYVSTYVFLLPKPVLPLHRACGIDDLYVIVGQTEMICG